MGTKLTKKRDVRTFEPDADVAEMLDAAIAAGGTVRDIINAAIRQSGPGVLRQQADEYRRRADQLERSISSDKR